MTESSLPWAGTTIGDHGPYTDANWTDMWRKLFASDRTTQGVLAGYGNELECTGAATPISINTGAALVDGKFYENTASVTKALSAAHATLTTIDIIALRKVWATQTVRLVVINGTPGAGAPALTQVNGATWEIPLYECWIAAVTGVVTLKDKRNYLRASIGPKSHCAGFGGDTGFTPSAWNTLTPAAWVLGDGHITPGVWMFGGGFCITCGTSDGIGKIRVWDSSGPALFTMATIDMKAGEKSILSLPTVIGAVAAACDVQIEYYPANADDVIAPGGLTEAAAVFAMSVN